MQPQAPEYLAAAAEYERRYGAPQEAHERALEAAENALLDNVRLACDVGLPHESAMAPTRIAYYTTSSVIGESDAKCARLLFVAATYALNKQDAEAAEMLRLFLAASAKAYADANVACYL